MQAQNLSTAIFNQRAVLYKDLAIPTIEKHWIKQSFCIVQY